MHADPVVARFLQDVSDDLSRDEVLCPTFVDASLRARLALKNPRLSPAELATVVAGEPVLSARIVALANGAALRRGGKAVNDVRTAVLRVGEDAVRNIAVALALQQIAHARELESFRDQARAIWAHSLEVAALAHVLAAHRGGISPDDAMFAGLVHDLGHLYAMWRAAQVPELVRQPDTLRALVHDAHAAVGAALLRHMALTETIILAVEEHESDPGRLAPGGLSQLLSVANRCADASGPTGAVAGQDSAAPAGAGLDEASAHAILTENVGEVAWLLATMKGQR
jgi:putative nucleotidyltransferase with HDIG domain